MWAGMLLQPMLGWLGRGPAGLGAGFLTLLVAVWVAPTRTAASIDGADDDRVEGGGEFDGLMEPVHAASRALRSARRHPGRGPPLVVLAALVIGTALIGAGWWSFRSEAAASSYLARMAPTRVGLEGVLRTDPDPGQFGWSGMLSVSRAVSQEGEVALGELVWVQGEGQPPAAQRGDRVFIEGSLDIPEEEFGAYLRSRGMGVVLRGDTFRRLGPSANPVIRFASDVRDDLRSAINELFPPREAGLLLGLALGDTSQLDDNVRRDFEATGLTHLLAVSGGNVAMVLAPIIGLGLVLRMPRWGRLTLCLATVVFFVILTGGEPSVLRAGVMAVLVIGAGFLGRPGRSWPILGGSVVILLLLDPFLAPSVGFQLSVGATAGIITLSTPIAARLAWMPRPLAAATSTTLAAQIGVAPLLLSYFHWIPLVSILANVLAFPLVEPAMLTGLAAAALHDVWNGAAVFLARIDLFPLRMLQHVADRLATAPIPSLTSAGGATPLVLGVVVVLGVVWVLRSGHRPPRAAILGGACVIPVFVWASALGSGSPSGLTVHFFDVGQGDAALVQAPDGANILIDGGTDEDQVAIYLASLGVKRLDAVIASHPHADHLEGLPQVLARYPVGVVLEPGCDEPSPSYEAFLDAVAAEEVPTRHPRTGDVVSIGQTRLEMLGPDECVSGTASDPNNDSLVFRLSYGEDAVLFPGDAEVESQQAILDQGGAVTAPVLKVAHHGGDTSVSEFTQAVDPQVAVISVGGSNDYGHPVPSVVESLQLTGAQVFRTDQEGTVTVRFAPEGITVESDTS